MTVYKLHLSHPGVLLTDLTNLSDAIVNEWTRSDKSQV